MIDDVDVESIPQGLTPASLRGLNAKAEALAYLEATTKRNTDGRTGLDGLGAELAAGGDEGDFGEALRAGFGGHHGDDGRFCLRYGVVDGDDDDEVDDGGDEDEGDDGVDEGSVGDDAAVQMEDEGGEVGLAADGGDERGDDVGDEGGDDGGEGGADDDGDGEIDDIAAHEELFEAFEHGFLLEDFGLEGV